MIPRHAFNPLCLMLFPLFAAANQPSNAAITLTRPTGKSPFAHCSVSGAGRSYVGSAIEPGIVTVPEGRQRRNAALLAVWVQDPWSNGGAQGLVAARSVDDGRHWQDRVVPFGACARRDSNVARVDSPAVTANPNGIVYLAAAGTSAASLSSAGASNAEAAFDMLLLATSSDGGVRWTHFHTIPFGQDIGKVSVAGDPRRPGVAYVTWDSEVGLWSSRTMDGGASWSRPRVIVPGLPQFPLPAGHVLLSDQHSGTLYLIYDYYHHLSKPRVYCHRPSRPACFTFAPSADPIPWGADLMIRSSTDGGRTWSHPYFIAQDLGVGRVGPSNSEWSWMARHRPSAAINSRTGEIAVTWQDSRFSMGRFDEVALSVSDRGGQHWSAPIRVDAGPGAALVPTVAFNSRGEIGVTYYQLRGQASGTHLPPADYWFREMSGTRHLAATRRVAGPLDLARLALTFAPFIVHSEGLVAHGTAFVPVFVAPDKDNKHTEVVTETILDRR